MTVERFGAIVDELTASAPKDRGPQVDGFDWEDEVKSWHIKSGRIDETVTAATQYAAWNTLRKRPAEEFGLIASAEPNGNGDPLVIQTEALMATWGRADDSARFHEAARAHGLVP
jgi:hypothetical protein